jgi:hypothetical protein
MSCASWDVFDPVLGVARGREARDAGLQQEPKLEPFQHCVEMEGGDEKAAVRLEVDHVLGGQPVQRLAHRRSRDGERHGQVALPQARPRAELAGLDQVSDAPVGEVDDRAGTDRLQGWDRRLRCDGRGL